MIQASCKGVSSLPERFLSHSRTTTKLARRVAIGKFGLTNAITEYLKDDEYSIGLQWDRGTHPVAIRNSLTELRRECRQNSPAVDVEICIWLELGACVKILLSATIAEIRGPAVRVSLGRMKLNNDQISSKSGHSPLTEQSCASCSTSHVWQMIVSRTMTSDDFFTSLPAAAHDILPSMSRTSVFTGSERPS